MLTKEQWKRRRERILYAKLSTIAVLFIAILVMFFVIIFA